MVQLSRGINGRTSRASIVKMRVISISIERTARRLTIPLGTWPEVRRWSMTGSELDEDLNSKANKGPSNGSQLQNIVLNYL